MSVDMQNKMQKPIQSLYKGDAQMHAAPKRPAAVRLTAKGFRLFGPLFPKAAGNLALKFFSTPRIRAKHKKNDELLLSARRVDWQKEDLVLRTYRWGEKGPKVLLVHGWESRATALRHLVPYLLERNFQVLAFDLPAHGDSEGTQTNMKHSAYFVQAMLEKHPDIQHVVAHSLGCGATTFALENLSRKLSRVSFVGFPSDVQGIFSRFYSFLELPEKVQRSMEKTMEKQFHLDIQAFKFTELLQQTEIGAVQLIHDELDPIIPFQDSVAVATALPKAEFLTTRGYGHFSLLKEPEALVRIADFIAGK